MKFHPEILCHPNIPKPLHGMNPRNILGQEWWDSKRREAYRKYDFCCWACGVHKSQAKYHHWLEGHECYEFDYPAGIAKLLGVVALCHSCHNYIHSGKLAMDLRARKITQEKHDDILRHGAHLIHQPNIQKPPFVKVSSQFGYAKWHEWRLILEGKEYYSQFKNFDEWRKFYSSK